MPDRFQKGLDIIRTAAEDALRGRGIDGAQVTCLSRGDDRPDALLTIAVAGSVETQTFSYDEVEDSGNAIDAPAAIKVRMLVSKFVR